MNDSSESKDDIAPIIPPETIDHLTTLLRNYKEAEAKLEEAKKRLRSMMEKHSIKSYNFGAFSATIAADSVTTCFDSKRFKEEHADLYKKYSSQKSKKGSFTLKLKDND